MTVARLIAVAWSGKYRETTKAVWHIPSQGEVGTELAAR